VYGLAADPFQPEAVRRLLRLKQRPDNKPILLLVESLRQVERLAARIPTSLEPLAARYWPGPLTVVLPAAPCVPETITAGTGTVAVRLPGSALTREIIRAARTPLTGTSANLSSRPAAETAHQVREQLPRGLAMILDGGPAPSRTPSTIVDLTGEPRVLRQGAIELRGDYK
jgi:L-threonylcarbamoyladenylate synthase